MKKIFLLTFILTSSFLIVNCENKQSTTGETNSNTLDDSASSDEIDPASSDEIDPASSDEIDPLDSKIAFSPPASPVDSIKSRRTAKKLKSGVTKTGPVSSDTQSTSEYFKLKTLTCSKEYWWPFSATKIYSLYTVYDNSSFVSQALYFGYPKLLSDAKKYPPDYKHFDCVTLDSGNLSCLDLFNLREKESIDSGFSCVLTSYDNMLL